MNRRQSMTPVVPLLLLLLLLLQVPPAPVSAAALSQHKNNVQLVPVHTHGGSAFFPQFPGGGIGGAATTSLVKVVQSGSRYGNAGQAGYYNNGYGSTGGYVYYDQLPSYGKSYGNSYSSSRGNSNNNYGGTGYVYYDQLPSYGKSYGNSYSSSRGNTHSNNNYGGKGYVYYDQLPSYNNKNGYGGYDSDNLYSNDYYDKSNNGYYGNEGYYDNEGARRCGDQHHHWPCHSARRSEGARRRHRNGY